MGQPRSDTEMVHYISSTMTSRPNTTVREGGGRDGGGEGGGDGGREAGREGETEGGRGGREGGLLCRRLANSALPILPDLEPVVVGQPQSDTEMVHYISSTMTSRPNTTVRGGEGGREGEGGWEREGGRYGVDSPTLPCPSCLIPSQS